MRRKPIYFIFDVGLSINSISTQTTNVWFNILRVLRSDPYLLEHVRVTTIRLSDVNFTVDHSMVSLDTDLSLQEHTSTNTHPRKILASFLEKHITDNVNITTLEHKGDYKPVFICLFSGTGIGYYNLIFKKLTEKFSERLEFLFINTSNNCITTNNNSLEQINEKMDGSFDKVLLNWVSRVMSINFIDELPQYSISEESILPDPPEDVTLIL